MRHLIVAWWQRVTTRAFVTINRSGQLTDNPIVCVSVGSRHGSQTVYVHEDTVQGNARATLDAKGLAHVLNIELWDTREGQ